jgi:hypothetical protein
MYMVIIMPVHQKRVERVAVGWVGHGTTLESDFCVPVGLKFGLQQSNQLTLIRRASRY